MIGDRRRPADRDDLSTWIAGNPVDGLATNFGRPASLFDEFPCDRVCIATTAAPWHEAREIEWSGGSRGQPDRWHSSGGRWSRPPGPPGPNTLTGAHSWFRRYSVVANSPRR